MALDQGGHYDRRRRGGLAKRGTARHEAEEQVTSRQAWEIRRREKVGRRHRSLLQRRAGDPRQAPTARSQQRPGKYRARAQNQSRTNNPRPINPAAEEVRGKTRALRAVNCGLSSQATHNLRNFREQSTYILAWWDFQMHHRDLGPPSQSTRQLWRIQTWSAVTVAGYGAS